MTDNDYPQSSCICYDTRNNFPKETGKPTNFSVRRENNQQSIPGEYFDTNNERVFRLSQEPHPRTGIDLQNPQVYTSSPGFRSYKYDPLTDNKVCSKSVYDPLDPRLFNAMTAQILPLDRPPIDSSVRLSNVYNENLRGYGQNYTDYKSVSGGQIQYYIDKSIEDPYFTPVFEISSNVKGEVYQDPMNAMKPAYFRQPLTSPNPLQNNMRGFSGLTSINDSTRFREDITGGTKNAGGLMARMNREKYSARWTNNFD
jgi:hypothetical protein